MGGYSDRSLRSGTGARPPYGAARIPGGWAAPDGAAVMQLDGRFHGPRGRLPHVCGAGQKGPVPPALFPFCVHRQASTAARHPAHAGRRTDHQAMRPRRKPTATACARSLTPSLAKIALLCERTVASEMPRRRAISGRLAPSDM